MNEGTDLGPELRNRLLAKPVAVFGGGVSGRAAAGLLRQLGARPVTYDENRAVEGGREFTADDSRRHRVAVVSPGFPSGHPWLERARQGGCVCLSEIEFAAQFLPGRLIVVTGTNGKTTLTEFLAFALNRHGISAVAAGNNGRALAEVAQNPGFLPQIIVCEVSSYQAERLSFFRPDVLLWTNFYEGHLDRHETLERYFRAKWNLLRLTQAKGGRILAGPTVGEAARRFGYQLPLTVGMVDDEDGAMPDWDFPETSAFYARPQRRNLCLARWFWHLEGFPIDELGDYAASFRPREHRLAQVAVRGGVRFWDDAKATNFAAVVAALDHFPQPVLWIGGGMDWGGDVAEFAGRIGRKIRAAFLIGETCERLRAVLRAHGVPAFAHGEVGEAVVKAFATARSGETVLFSPGFPSLDMFSSYAQRGNCFRKAVFRLKEKANGL